MSRLNYVETGKAYTACMKDTPHVPLRHMWVFVSFFSCGLHRRRKLVVERGLDNGEEGVGMEDGEGA